MRMGRIAVEQLDLGRLLGGGLTQRRGGAEEETPPLVIAWLGQAGFWMRWGEAAVTVDPYLSDSLAKKYRGTRYPHVRMMAPPVRAEDVVGLTAVCCTHAHTDHMDPETLAPLAAGNPACRFIVPRATLDTAAARGVPGDRTIAMNAGETQTLAPGLRIHAVASAHEELQTDAQGNHCFLGYVLDFGGLLVYHSGDCVPYPGLAATLAEFRIDLAILPVNGRDAERRDHGILGNFTFAEAAALCGDAGIPALVACHFGMFDFNTLDEAWLDRQIAALPPTLEGLRPNAGAVYRLADR